MSSWAGCRLALASASKSYAAAGAAAAMKTAMIRLRAININDFPGW